MERLKREISRKYGCKPRIDGKAESLWIVIDYGNVVIHVLSPEMREAYQLESLWGDAPSETHIENLTNKAPK
jgi:ribosome-associated protein